MGTDVSFHILLFETKNLVNGNINEGAFGLGMPSCKSSQWFRAFPNNFCWTAGLYAFLSLYPVAYLDYHHLTPDYLSAWIRAIHPHGVLKGHCKGNSILVIREGQKQIKRECLITTIINNAGDQIAGYRITNFRYSKL